MKKAMRTKAFTLIELLVVMFITAILMTLILIPVFQSFNLTRAGQAFADAQEKAALVSDRVAREIGNATSVRDNSGIAGAVQVVVPAQDGSATAVTLPYAKMDLVMPSEGDPARINGAFVNPVTGKADPTLERPKGQVNLPVTPGGTIVRYFIGLRQPLNDAGVPQRYTNPYDGLLMARSAERDNLYVLFRAEVPVFDLETRQLVDRDGNGRPDYFVADATGGPADLDDPAFFTILPGVDYDYGTGTFTPAGTLKAERIRNWMRVAQVITEVSRYDMIQPVYNLSTRQVAFDAGVPRINPLVQFRPARVTSEPVAGQIAGRLGDESDTANLGPETFRTNMGDWSNAIVRLLPQGYDPAVPALNDTVVGRTLSSRRPMSVFIFDPDAMSDDTTQGTLVFAGDVYDPSVSRYPFSAAVDAANVVSGWLSNANLRELFTPFAANKRSGRVEMAFGIDEVGVNALSPTPEDPLAQRSNLPIFPTGPALTPANDNVASGVFSDAQYQNVNRRFNKIWADFPALRPDIHRFLDLRVVPQDDGSPSPLHPILGFPRARIVPGSEVVYGPDQNPGPNFGREIRYTRTTRRPGPNQYRLNYTNLPEPDYSLLGLPTPPAVYTPTDFVSAIIQPRYRAGYLELNSDPNVAIPDPMRAIRATDGVLVDVPGRIRVFYRFQFSGGQDVVSVDYDSREKMEVLLTIRNFAQAGIPASPNPQNVTLKASARVRNLIR